MDQWQAILSLIFILAPASLCTARGAPFTPYVEPPAVNMQAYGASRLVLPMRTTYSPPDSHKFNSISAQIQTQFGKKQFLSTVHTRFLQIFIFCEL